MSWIPVCGSRPRSYYSVISNFAEEDEWTRVSEPVCFLSAVTVITSLSITAVYILSIACYAISASAEFSCYWRKSFCFEARLSALLAIKALGRLTQLSDSNFLSRMLYKNNYQA